MLTFIEIAQRYRPRWLVWENVPGVLSSNGGRDFGSLLGALGQLGYGWAYRVLDAQWFGVAQRRRRVFVVGYVGDWRPPAAVLFERDSLRGNPAPRRKAGKGTSEPVKNCLDVDVCGTLTAGFGKVGAPEVDAYTCIPEKNWPVDVAPTLNAHFGEKQGLEDQHALGGAGLFVPAPIFATSGQANAAFSEDQAQTLMSSHEQPYIAVGQPIAIRTANTSSNGHGFSNETAYTLDRTQGQAVAVDLYNQSVSDTNQTLSSSATDASHQGAVIVPNVSMAVRRLTPVECERLQGFPDNFTRIPWRNKPAEQCPDGPRYKALGNSMAVPVMRWIGERIQMFSEIEKDLNQQEAA